MTHELERLLPVDRFDDLKFTALEPTLEHISIQVVVFGEDDLHSPSISHRIRPGSLLLQ